MQSWQMKGLCCWNSRSPKNVIFLVWLQGSQVDSTQIYRPISLWILSNLPRFAPTCWRKGDSSLFRTETEVRGIGGIWNHSSTEKSTIFFLKRQLGPTLLLSDQIATPSFKDYECGQLGNPSSLAPKKQYVNLHVNDTNPSCQTLPKSPISRTWFSNLLGFRCTSYRFQQHSLTKFFDTKKRWNHEAFEVWICVWLCDPDFGERILWLGKAAWVASKNGNNFCCFCLRE